MNDKTGCPIHPELGDALLSPDTYLASGSVSFPEQSVIPAQVGITVQPGHRYNVVAQIDWWTGVDTIGTVKTWSAYGSGIGCTF